MWSVEPVLVEALVVLLLSRMLNSFFRAACLCDKSIAGAEGSLVGVVEWALRCLVVFFLLLCVYVGETKAIGLCVAAVFFEEGWRRSVLPKWKRLWALHLDRTYTIHIEAHAA